MGEIRALIWKEWCETRLFLWIGWGVFIGLPTVSGLEGLAMYAHRFEFNSSPLLVFSVPVFAVLMGVAATCRDLRPGLDNFWRAVPVGPVRLFSIKAAVSSLVLIAAFGAPLAIEIKFNPDKSWAAIATNLSFQWLASLGIAFAAGCILRRNSHAATVSVVGVLLLVTLPIVLPPLEAFDPSRIVELGLISPPFIARQPAFVEGMLTVAVCAFVVGLLAVRFRLHIDSRAPLLYGVIAAAFLTLLGSAAYQLGTNLPVLDEVPYSSHHEWASAIVGKASNAVVYSTIGSFPIPGWVGAYYAKVVDVVAGRLVQGPPFRVSANDTPNIQDHLSAHSDKHPGIRFFVTQDNLPNGKDAELELSVWSDNGWDPANIALWKKSLVDPVDAYLFAVGDRLFVVGRRTIVIDISDPWRPKKLSDEPIEWAFGGWGAHSQHIALQLPPMPGIPARERLKFALRFRENAAFDGDLLCILRAGTVDVFKLKSLTDQASKFDAIGTYTQTPLQSMFGTFTSSVLRHGLLYATSAGGGYVSMFEVGEPWGIRLIGHFAAPGVIGCVPLDDGRAIAYGSKLWLLGPPRRH